MASTDVGGAGSAPISADIAVVCRYWAEFDLEELRPKLDEMGLKVAEFQEEAMQNRRKLAESTKEFKRTYSDEASTKAFGSLLKQYQEEIDRLTKRAKHGEGAFLNLYQKLFEAPDPAPSLSQAFETASRATDLEAQCRKLSQELAEYKAESTQIKNQDLTIRKLEEKIRNLEANADEKDREIQEVAEKAVADADAARMAQMQERELQLTAMLAQAHASLATMQRLHQATQNQLFAIQSQGEEERVGRQSELELASAELERAQERLTSLEREKQALVQRLSASAGGGGSSGGGAAAAAEDGSQHRHAGGAGEAASSGRLQAGSRDGHSSLEDSLKSELAVQREQCARLRSELGGVRQELEAARSMWESRVEGLRSTLAATEQHAHALEQEMRMRPTVQQVEDLRQHIRVLQAVRYNTLEAEDDEEEGAGTGRPVHSAGTSLESALLQKNRHLEHELTMARLKAVDNNAELEAAQGRVADLERQVARQLSLIDRLEEDLVASRGAAGMPPGGGGGGAGGSGGRLSGLLAGGASAAAGAESEAPEDQGASMLRVLCGQRDRFRQKAVELEEELARIRAELASAKCETAAARADNVALVERLRYVHGFKQQDRARDVEAGGKGVEVERKYARIYEEGINPFKEFQGEQREKQKQRMGVVDKAMYKFGQLVFGSQSVRLFTFVYLLVLHLLVFASLTRMTHHSSNQLYQHQQAVLDSKHDAMGILHHEGGKLP